jgi:APA family basic amino acid/polyamine antiporter
MTFGAYLSAVFPTISPTGSAMALVILLTAVHCLSRQTSSSVQQAFTALKVLLILLFCAVIFIWGGTYQAADFSPQAGDEKLIFSGAFAVALIYVNYAYTGWNSATYVTSELENPQRSLPIVLLVGTCIVMALYLMLNFTFLSAAPISILEGKLEVGVIVADHALGANGGKAMGAILALLLISTVSAMTMAGPRVLQAIGEDFSLFSKLAELNRHGVPMIAIIFQGALALVFIVSATFESVLIFSSFVLGVNTLFSVIGVFVLRWKKMNIKGAYKTFAYPFAPLIYLSVTLWTLIYVLISRPIEGWIGVAMIAAGAVLYYFSANQSHDSGR